MKAKNVRYGTARDFIVWFSPKIALSFYNFVSIFDRVCHRTAARIALERNGASYCALFCAGFQISFRSVDIGLF